MTRALFFSKRCGGVFWRCGHCGEDQPVADRKAKPLPVVPIEAHRLNASPCAPRLHVPTPEERARELARAVRDVEAIELEAPGALPLMLGSQLFALVCAGCARPVREALGHLAPRSLPDLSTSRALLGDF